MNVISCSSSSDATTSHYYISIPRTFIFILIFLFVIGFGVPLFILIEVKNALFFLASLSLSAIVAAIIIWNAVSFRRNTSLLLFLRSFPVSDLRLARNGQLVKITGPVSCGEVSLESSFENVGGCVYTSTLLYEYQGFGFKAFNLKQPCFLWRLAFSENMPGLLMVGITTAEADLILRLFVSHPAPMSNPRPCDMGIRILVKAGCGCRIVPLIIESRLVNTRKHRILSPNLTKWLTDRNLATNSRVIRLEEGYIKEGDCATIIGMLHRRGDDIAMVVQPPELISTGCLWQRLLSPVNFDGLLLGLP